MGNETFTKPELSALAALRARFLDGSNAGGGYWKNEGELALYDASFGEHRMEMGCGDRGIARARLASVVAARGGLGLRERHCGTARARGVGRL